MKSKSKHYVTQLVKIVIAVGLIYWLWSSDKINFSALKNFLDPKWALLGVVLISINIFICSERWRTLLQIQNRNTTPWKGFKLSLMGIFFNYAMPGGVGGDVVKAFYFHKDHPNSKVIAMTSVLMDRVIGLYSMMLLGLGVMLYDWDKVTTLPILKTMFFAVLGMTLVATVGFYFLFSAKFYKSGLVTRLIRKLPFSEKFQKLYDSLHAYGTSLPLLSKVVVLSWLAQVFSIFYLILAGELSGGGAPWITYFIVAPLGYIATGLPITPAGVGVGQAAFYYLFNLYLGQTTNLGSNAITAMQVGQFVVGLLGAFFYLRRGQPVTEDFTESQDLVMATASGSSTNTEYAPSR